MIFLSSKISVVLLSILIFLLIILVLVALLLYAKTKLTQKGKVQIKINENDLEVDPGSTLLSTLANNNIYLPSACGGGGTCGMCKCQVFEGAGEILPTETGFFTRRERQNHWRLGCQVKVKENLIIKVPEEILGVKKFEGTVISNKNVATFIKEFIVKIPDNIDFHFKSGGYIQIDVPICHVDFSKDINIEKEYQGDWDKFGLWNLHMQNPEETFRAYSMATYPAEGKLVKLNVRIATPPWDGAKKKFMDVNSGICSSYIFSLKSGDKIMMSGPYGEFFIKDTEREMIYIGGGAGMAPLRSHIFHLLKTEKSKRKISFWYGARSKREVFYEDEFRALEKEFPNFKFNIALSEPMTEDKWTGYQGFIHKILFDNYLSKLDEPEEIEYYFCGPPVMNDAALKMLDNLGVPKEMIAFDDFGG